MTEANTSANSTDNVQLDADVATAAKAQAEKSEKELPRFLNDLLRKALGLPNPDENKSASKSGSMGG